jgi:LPS-assembly protein
VNKTGRLAGLILTSVLVGLFMACTALPVLAASELIRIETKSPVDVRADKIEYNHKTERYVAVGEVELISGPLRLFADRVELHKETMVAEASGKVRLTGPGQVVTGERMVVNMQDATGKIYNGFIYIDSGHYYIRGRELEKTGKETFKVFDGGFTTCDGSNPNWELTSGEMEVTVDGYGTAKSAAFRIRDVPVLWTPYAVFPAKSKRESGFLLPHIGDSERDGFIVSLPYFQTLGESADATVVLNYMSKRGWGIGAEGRYFLAPGDKGMIQADFLPDDRLGDELFESGENAEAYDSRYWVRAKADQKLFNNRMKMTLDIDLPSDQDYLREFTYGHSGYDQSAKRFDKWFGRQLDSKNQLTRTNRLNLARSWARSSFNGTLLYYEDTDSPDDNESTLQQLPTLSFDASRQALGETGLYFQMLSDYTYFWRQEGSTGHISDVVPSLYLPLNFNDYLEVEPAFTVSPRLFAVEREDTEDPDNEETGASFRWNTRIRSSSYMYRVFDFGSAEDPLKVKHAFRPFLNWRYQPEIEEEDVAKLAQRGDQTRTNILSYGINNTLTSKVIGKDPKTGELGPIYREFARISLSQEFDLDEYLADEEVNEPWGQIVGRIELDPVNWFFWQAETGWDPHDTQFDYFQTELTARDFRGDSISLDYIWRNDLDNQISARLRLAINKEWSLRYKIIRDFEDEITFEQTIGVDYEGQCWGIRAYWTDQELRQSGWWLVFSLKGFGDIFGYGQLSSE